MNLQQRIVLWLGVLVFTFLTLHPPWVALYTSRLGDSSHYERALGSHFVWHDFPPERAIIQPDFRLLLLEWIAVAALTAALLWTFKGKPDWQPHKSSAVLIRILRTVSMVLLSKRIVRVALTAAGLLFVVGPSAFHWEKWRLETQAYTAKVADFKRRLPELARTYPLGGWVVVGEEDEDTFAASDRDKNGFGFVPDSQPKSTAKRKEGGDIFDQVAQENQTKGDDLALNVPAAGQLLFSARMSGREIADALHAKYAKLPSWYLTAITAGVDPASVPTDQKPGDPPLTFSLYAAFQNSLTLESLGLVLLVACAACCMCRDPHR